MNQVKTKKGRVVNVLTLEECRQALGKQVYDSAGGANDYLKCHARRLGGFAPYVARDQLVLWGNLTWDENARTPAQVRAAKQWAAAMRAGRDRKAKERDAAAQRIEELEAELARPRPS
jgi:hypothetical protein